MMNALQNFSIHLPDWIAPFMAAQPQSYASIEDRMRLAIELSHLNIHYKTGGPFAAAIFEQKTGTLLSIGLNLVVTQKCSIAHAEMVAIALAQKKLDTHNLKLKGDFQLASSCQPCAMCLGAIPWSGIQSLLCGAGGEDAESIGFDEGAKPEDWISQLNNRNITVKTGILRQNARDVLLAYKASQGIVY